MKETTYGDKHSDSEKAAWVRGFCLIDVDQDLTMSLSLS
jgi:hypothetical protein